MGMGLGGKCGMFFLVTINVLFLLLGIGLLIVGIIMKVDSKVVSKTEVVSSLNEVSFNGTLKLGNVASSLSILIICIGAFILAIAALGGFGACCKNRCLLVTYAIVVLLIFVVQVIGVALWFTMKDKVENTVKEGLNTSMKKYDGVDSTNELSKGWDLLFIGFDCCGIDAVHLANNPDEFDGTAWWGSPSRAGAKVPTSCCSSSTETDYKTGSATCTALTSGYRTKGCYQAFKDFLKKYESAALGIGIALLVIEIIAVVFSFVLCRAIGKEDMIV